MKKSTFIYSGIALFLLVLVTFFISEDSAYVADKNNVILYNNFNESIKNFQKISISTNNNNYDIIKKNNVWVIPKYYNYPVDIKKINDFLLTLNGLNLVDKKTNNPKYHSDLGLSSKPTGNIESKRVIIFGQKQQKIYDFILGNKAKNSLEENARYIRKSDDDQVWLFAKKFNVHEDALSWANTSLLKLGRWRIQNFDLKDFRNKKNNFSIYRNNYEDQMYKLKDIPKNYIISNSYKTNSIVSTLEGLEIKDIIKSKNLIKLKPIRLVKVNTFDGLELSISIYELKADKYFTISLASNLNIRKELETDGPKVIGIPAMKKFTEVQNEVKKFSYLKDWAFKLDQASINNFLVNNNDLIKKKEKKD